MFKGFLIFYVSYETCFQRRKRYSHRIYYFTDYQLVVVVHDASTSQVAKCFLAGRPLMPKSLLQRFKFRKNPEPKQQIFDLFSFRIYTVFNDFGNIKRNGTHRSIFNA
jgi:hypothetical protein